MTGTAALAMDDPHAMALVAGGFREESGEREPRLLLGHPVQIEFVAYRVVASPQAPDDRFRHAVPAEAEFLAGLDVERVGVERERIGEDARFVGAARGGARPVAFAFRRRFCLPERAHAAHRGTEQLAFLVLDGGSLCRCARATELTV